MTVPTRNLADDMLDFKYWDNSGRGVGIRDIEVGKVLMDFATVYNNVSYDDDTGGTNYSAVLMPEFRVHDIDFLGGNLTLGVNYAYVIDDTDIITYAGEGNYERDGYMLTVNHKANIGGAYNILTVQANGGIGVGGWTNGDDQLHLTTPGTGYRILNHGFFTLNEQWSGQYSLAYENIDLDDADGKDWFAAGVRPKYTWNDFTATEVEVGYQLVNSDSVEGENSAWKATIAQRINFGAVPHLRLYATYADADSQWSEDDFGTHSSLTDSSNSWTFGAQVEAWW